MFDIGIPEILVIIIVAILVIGPKRMPELATAAGKGLAEFKRAMNNVKEEFKIDDVRSDENNIKDSLLFSNSNLDEEKDEKKESQSQAEKKASDNEVKVASKSVEDKNYTVQPTTRNSGKLCRKP